MFQELAGVGSTIMAAVTVQRGVDFTHIGHPSAWSEEPSCAVFE